MEKHKRTKERLRTWREESTRDALNYFTNSSRDCNERYGTALTEAEVRARLTTQEARETREAAEREIAEKWRDGQDKVGRAMNRLRATALEHYPDWNSPFWYNPPAAIKVPVAWAPEAG